MEDEMPTLELNIPVSQKFVAGAAAFAAGFFIEHVVKKGVHAGFKAYRARKA